MLHNNTSSKLLLKKNGLSLTNTRIEILDFLLQQKQAISNADIEKKYLNIDRITIYRTLQTFLKKGLIHNIPSAENSIKYALCFSDCTEHHHYDNHYHLLCKKCTRTICINNSKPATIELPTNIDVDEIQILIKGTCSDCTKKRS